MTAFLIAAPRVAFSVRRVLCAPLRFDAALFVVLRLRGAFARFEAVFVVRDALFVVLRLRDTFARFEAVFLARGRRDQRRVPAQLPRRNLLHEKPHGVALCCP